MKKIITFALSLSVFLCSSAYAQRSLEAIVNYQNVPIKTASGKKLSGTEFKDAVIRAGKTRNWEFVNTQEGKLVGTLNVNNKHTISVNIDHTADSFSINYKDSINMKYGSLPIGTDSPTLGLLNNSFKGPTANAIAADANTKFIHPAYNEWVKSFLNAINYEFSGI